MAEGALWTDKELVRATGGTLSSATRGPMNGVSIDTRTLAPGDIYVAIKGERLDGHDFAEAALKAGAGVAIVASVTDAMRAAGPVLQVGDPLRALEDLGRAARSRSGAKIIGVTGSVGKTSTKEALKLAFSASGVTHASSASFNNHWGVPLSLARMGRDTAYGIFEIGMNHAGEITPLAKMVRPHVAIITTIAPSHLGHFKSLAEIADAKAEIFAGLEPQGFAVINRDTGEYDLAETRMGFVAVINDLHKGRDTGQGWSVLIDISAVLMVLVSITGTILIIFLRRRRVAGYN